MRRGRVDKSVLLAFMVWVEDRFFTVMGICMMCEDAFFLDWAQVRLGWLLLLCHDFRFRGSRLCDRDLELGSGSWDLSSLRSS
jgi:hypothetical protein